jgi:hypothetical protein
MRFIWTLHFLEFALIGMSLAFLVKASNTKVSLYLMAGALGLNLADRIRISRRLEKRAISESERLSTKIEGLMQAVPKLAGKIDVEDQIAALQTQIKALPPPPEPVDLTALESEIASLNTRLSPLEELNPVQIQNDFSSLREKQGQLSERLEELPTTEGLFEGLEQTTASVINWAEHLIEHIQTIRPYDYHLVCDRGKSREELINAPKETQYHLILVNPWLTKAAISGEVRVEIRKALIREPKVRIDIGWGHWEDIALDERTKITRKDFLDRVELRWKYNAMRFLEQQERRHQNRFKLKLLGTHEKYLVCDHKFAILGSHNFLTSGDSSTEREVGIRTDDPNIIKDLIDRFKKAPNLEIPK